MNPALLLLSCAALAVPVGCTERASEPASAEVRARSALVAPVPSSFPGYVHVSGASKLHFGGNVHTDTYGAFSRWVGDDAVFAVYPNSGMVVASQDSGSPASSVGPYTTDADAHSALVQSYFVGAGLPSDQILVIGVFTRMSASGVAGGPPPTPKFLAYESTLYRAVGGYRVPESLATAEFNANAEVLRETVYWPALPGSVVTDATALTNLLADPVQGPAYLARLPIPATSPVVGVHHTPGRILEPTPFVAFASCDVRDGDLLRHFDISGDEMLLAGELPAPPPPAAATGG